MKQTETFILILGLIFPLTTLAGNIQIGGFINQSFIQTTNNGFSTQDTIDSASADFREVGLNLFSELTDNLHISSQLLSRTAGENEKGEPRFDYLLAEYKLFSDLEKQYGIRVGRVKKRYGFYNETRDVVFTRLGILLPQAVYFDSIYELQRSSDGLNLFFNQNNSNFSLSTNLVYAWTPVDSDDWAVILFGDEGTKGVVKARQPSPRFDIYLDSLDNRLRFGFGTSTVYGRHHPSSNSSLYPGKFDFSVATLSFQLNENHWDFTTEYSYYDRYFEGIFYEDIDKVYKEIAFGYYFDFGLKPTESTRFYIRYDVEHDDRKDLYGSKYEEETGDPAHLRYAFDTTLGVKYKLSQNILFGLEYHKIRGASWLPYIQDVGTEDIQKFWELYAATVSYRF